MTRHYSAALPIAFVVLRILIVLNWLFGAAILVLLFLPHAQWIMTEMHLTPSAEAARLVWGLRAVAVIGLITVPINQMILTRLLAMVATVRAGDPFVGLNARRLQVIAWALLALQILGLFVALVDRAVSTPAHPLHLDSSFSIAGWLAVLFAFILARVFAEGALMRADLEGTI